MTRAELRTMVYELTGRPSDYARLSTTQIDDYAYSGAVRLAQETLPASLLDFVTVTTANGTSTYKVTGNPLRVVSAQVGGVVLTPITIQRLYTARPDWQSTSNGTPTHWLSLGRDGVDGSPNIRLWPTPGSVLSVSVMVLKKPATLPSSGEILEWDRIEQEALAYYAAYRHLSNKAETDQDGTKDAMLKAFQDIVDMYRRLNGVDSFNSQEAGVQTGWRTQA